MFDIRNRYLFDDTQLVTFKSTRVDTLGVRLYFPTDQYNISITLDTITVSVTVVCKGITIRVLKAVAFELPGCVECFEHLSYTIKSKLMDVIHDNVLIQQPHETYTVTRDNIYKYSDTLNIISGDTFTSGMSLDTICCNKQMDLALTMAMTSDGGVGYNQHLPWWLPDELYNFRDLTTGKILICGSSTYRNMGPLPHRLLIVMTSSGLVPEISGSVRKGLVIVASTYGHLLGLLATMDVPGTQEVHVIGGPTIIGLFKDNFDVYNQTIVDDSALRNQPNVFMETNPVHYLGDGYTTDTETRSGSGWTRSSHRCVRNCLIK